MLQIKIIKLEIILNPNANNLSFRNIGLTHTYVNLVVFYRSNLTMSDHLIGLEFRPRRSKAIFPQRTVPLQNQNG